MVRFQNFSVLKVKSMHSEVIPVIQITQNWYTRCFVTILVSRQQWRWQPSISKVLNVCTSVTLVMANALSICTRCMHCSQCKHIRSTNRCLVNSLINKQLVLYLYYILIYRHKPGKPLEQTWNNITTKHNLNNKCKNNQWIHFYHHHYYYVQLLFNWSIFPSYSS